MRIVVYPHSMEIGGSQFNAVQLAGAVRDRGHEVIVLSEPGPMVERVRSLGLEHLEIPLHRSRPSPKVYSRLLRLARERRVDVVHGYEWAPIVEAFLGPRLRLRTPVVGTILSMSVASFVPRLVPFTVGTQRICEAATAAGHRRVTVLEPPVDIESDNPSVDGRSFRAQHNIRSDEVLVAIICRLVPELKLEGLLSTCDAVGELARSGYPVRLIIVGNGSAYDDVAERAANVNAVAGRQIVEMSGELPDPRTAYAAADVIVGQGGSALRGMAFGKPLVVVGEEGFSELLTPLSVSTFLQQGWYGLGPGSLGTGSAALCLALKRLVSSQDVRKELGGFARQVVLDRYNLKSAAALLEAEYVGAADEPISGRDLFLDLTRSAKGILAYKLQRKYQRWRGTAATDDGNARAAISRVLATKVPVKSTADAS